MKKYLAIIMGYNIELSSKLLASIDFKKFILNTIVDTSCNYEYTYHFQDIERAHINKLNECYNVMGIHISLYEDCLLVLKQIRTNKKIHIDCLYKDSYNETLIYASNHYLKMIEKDKVADYRSRNYSEEEKNLLALILKSTLR